MQENSNKTINISLNPGSIIKILFILLAAYFAFVVRDLILVILTAVILASAIEPLTRKLIKWRFPRPIAVVTIYLSTLGVLVFLAAAFLPPLTNDIKDVISTIPQYVEAFSASNLNKLPGVSILIEQFNSSIQNNSLFEQIKGFTGTATLSFFATVSTIFGGIFSLILIIVFSFYLSVQENGIENFLRLVTPIQKEKYVIDLWKRSQRKIGLWMQGQLLLGLIVGVLVFLGLSILGVKNAFLLAVFAGVFELIPVFGPVISSIPAIVIALIQDGFILALLVLGLFIIVQQFENHLIYPLVVKKIVGIPALISIIALIIGGQIAGFLGLIISVPLTAVLMEYLSDVEKAKMEEMRRLGDTN